MASEIMAGYREAFAGFSIKREVKTEQGFLFEMAWSDQSGPVRGLVLIATRDTQVFEVDIIASEADFNRQAETIEGIAGSFRLEEPRPFELPRNRTLTLLDAGPITLDPAMSQESRSHSYIANIFGGLVTFDKDLHIVPDIAERWQVEGTTYTFFLRRGARFHSGREVKAADFKYSWERAASPSLGSPTAPVYLNDIVGIRDVLEGRTSEISGVQVIDDYTLKVTIDAPKAYFLSKLTYSVAFVVDQENVAQGTDWWHQPNGTGPFRLKKWQPELAVVLEASPAHHLGTPQIQYVLFRLWGGIPLVLYETGEIDAATVGVSNIERVSDPTNPLSRELHLFPQLNVSYISFNHTRPPFDDPLVRRAFAMSIDKDKLARVVLKDMVQPAGGFLPPGLPGYNPDLTPLSFDPSQAQEMLDASSYGGAEGLPIITYTTSGEGGPASDLDSAILQEIRINLGVEFRIRQLSPEIYFYRLVEEKDDLFDFGWNADYPDPQNFLDILFHSDSQQNDGEYTNPKLDVLLEQVRVEPDRGKRLRLYQEIEQGLVDDAAAIPLWFGRNYMLIKPYVKGFALSPLGIPMLREVSLNRP
ncbi:MAG: peptide ABC transporter substrate-binding protein [Dehalococcoidia bacterium]|jgi:oligopeptide transport system substrate-binding protein|nr:peptide ABC transporter substrate-binding protein [Dehalococcoidia bacterium]